MLGPAEPHDFLTFSASPIALGGWRELEGTPKSERVLARSRIVRFLFRTLAISLLLAGLGLALTSALVTSPVTTPDRLMEGSVLKF